MVYSFIRPSRSSGPPARLAAYTTAPPDHLWSVVTAGELAVGRRRFLRHTERRRRPHGLCHSQPRARTRHPPPAQIHARWRKYLTAPAMAGPRARRHQDGRGRLRRDIQGLARHGQADAVRDEPNAAGVDARRTVEGRSTAREHRVALEWPALPGERDRIKWRGDDHDVGRIGGIVIIVGIVRIVGGVERSDPPNDERGMEEIRMAREMALAMETAAMIAAVMAAVAPMAAAMTTGPAGADRSSGQRHRADQAGKYREDFHHGCFLAVPPMLCP